MDYIGNVNAHTTSLLMIVISRFNNIRDDVLMRTWHPP